jgi:hypothetical protein
MSELNGYELSKRFWAFAFNKPECKAIHAGIYFFMVDLNNRLGWKESFGLPNESVMEALSIGNRKTLYDALDDLKEWGLIKILSSAINQHTSRVVALCLYENEQAHIQALHRHMDRLSTGTDTGSVHIDKPLNPQTPKPLNPKTVSKKPGLDFDLFWLPYPKKEAKKAAQKVWDKLSIEKQQKAIDALPSHITKWAEKDNLYVPNASKWFNEERWEDVLDVSQTTAGPRLKPEFRNYQYWDDNTNGEKENIVYFTFKHPMNGDWLNIKGRKEQYEMLLNQYGAHCVKSCHE